MGQNVINRMFSKKASSATIVVIFHHENMTQLFRTFHLFTRREDISAYASIYLNIIRHVLKTMNLRD